LYFDDSNLFRFSIFEFRILRVSGKWGKCEALCGAEMVCEVSDESRGTKGEAGQGRGQGGDRGRDRPRSLVLLGVGESGFGKGLGITSAAKSPISGSSRMKKTDEPLPDEIEERPWSVSSSPFMEHASRDGDLPSTCRPRPR